MILSEMATQSIEFRVFRGPKGFLLERQETGGREGLLGKWFAGFIEEHVNN